MAAELAEVGGVGAVGDDELGRGGGDVAGWLPRSQPVAIAAMRIRVEEILRTMCSSSYNTKS